MKYPAVYSDLNGSEATFLDNDGERLCLVVRGVTFYGSDFDALVPEQNSNSIVLSAFTLNNFGELCSYHLEFQVMLPLLSDTGDTHGNFTFKLRLGDPAEHGGIQSYGLCIKLSYKENEFDAIHAPEFSTDFETQLLALNRQLPASLLPKCCFNCQYSDYSVFGQSFFGSMMCFRNIKNDYSRIRTKDEFMRIMDKFERRVQEIYLCSDFQKRIPGAGYRG